jgi:hypothetical protein
MSRILHCLLRRKAQKCPVTANTDGDDDLRQTEATAGRAAMTTGAEADAFLAGRGTLFFRAVEHAYGEFPGPLYLGNHPSPVDFCLAGCLLVLKYLFGDARVNAALVRRINR